MKNILVLLLLAALLSQCGIFKKSKLESKVVIALADTLFVPTLLEAPVNTKYIYMVTPQYVMSSFIKGFKKEAEATPNVVLQFDTLGADFILRFKKLEVSEGNKKSKVNNAQSAYNGQEVVYNTLFISAYLSMKEVKNPSKKLPEIVDSKMRGESGGTDHELQELMAGNHPRLLGDNVVLKYSEDVGHKIWVPLTQTIYRVSKGKL